MEESSLPVREEIIQFIQSAIEQHRYRGAVIGISGGVDSAVVAALAVQALGKQRVHGLLLPERDSSPQTLSDSLLVCDHLHIERTVKPITRILRSLGVYRLQPSAFLVPRKIQEAYVRKQLKTLSANDAYLQDLRNEGGEAFLRGLAYYRAKHRVRMVCLYLEAEQRQFAVVGTTNRTEAVTGFYVKWGDDSADLEPILHLYKSQVFELAEQLGIPERIRTKSPSPDLIPGITDEFMLGMAYPELDAVLVRMAQGNESLGEPEKVQRVRELLDAAKFRTIRNLSLAKASS